MARSSQYFLDCFVEVAARLRTWRLLYLDVLLVMVFQGIFLMSFMWIMGCEQAPLVRNYTESLIAPPPLPKPTGVGPASPMSASTPPAGQAGTPASGALDWILPEAFALTQGDSLRMLSFAIKGHGDSDGSIVFLPGQAGGIDANVKRWLGQLELTLDEAAFAAFLKTAETIEAKDGMSFLAFDFTRLARDQGAASFLAAVATTEVGTYFLKLKGPAQLLSANKAPFNALCASLRKKVVP